MICVPEIMIVASEIAIVEEYEENEENGELEEDEELVSFDVVSLYTNVPVLESIHVCADLLFSRYSIPVDKETFIELAKIASCNVLMLTHDGYYIQTEGLAMGSPPNPHLANGWMSQFDPVIKGEAKLYFRYMDDILRERATSHTF